MMETSDLPKWRKKKILPGLSLWYRLVSVVETFEYGVKVYSLVRYMILPLDRRIVFRVVSNPSTTGDIY